MTGERSVTTTFTWDVARSIPQVIDDGNLMYVYGIGRILQAGSIGLTRYYLADGLGSTMALTDSRINTVGTTSNLASGASFEFDLTCKPT